MPSSATPGTRKQAAFRSRTNLSRERIVTAALGLLDREGLDALSMRRLAQELDVGTMTLYGYFRNKDELLDAVVDMGAESIRLPELEGPWRDQLRDLMRAVREALLEHPGVVELRLRRPLLSPGALRLAQAALRILREAGFDEENAGLAYRSLLVFTFGCAAFAPDSAERPDRRQLERRLAFLPRDQWTELFAVAPVFERMTARELYEFGLERMLDSLEAQLAGGARAD
jgi:AcrR family transcriptional regulator